MGILKSTTNFMANAKYKFQKFLSANLKDVPATGGTALPQAWWYPPNLNPFSNISRTNSLMLAVEHMRSPATRDYSFISTEGGSFKVVQDNPPNFSILRDEDYFWRRTYEIHAGRIRWMTDYEILATCNKWMLLICNKAQDGGPYELLWNPNTNEVSPLPFSAWPPRFRDLNVNWNRDGLGFDPASNDYKVVRFGLWHDNHGLWDDNFVQETAHAALFSLKNGYWKRIPYPHCPRIESLGSSGVHINGISYWIALLSPGISNWIDLEPRKTGPGPGPARLNATIVSFDFRNENFPELIPLPDRLVNLDFLHIFEFHGSLATLVSKYKRGEPVLKEGFDFEIWVWNIDNGWCFDSAYNVPPLDNDVCVERVLGLYKNDKALFQDSKYSVLLYDCRTRVLKDLGIRDERGYDMKVYPYVQSTSRRAPFQSLLMLKEKIYSS